MVSQTPSIRTLLVLARASNLPTVWTNCLAGWLLAGGGDWTRFLLLCAGASCLYTGGMFMNDAFDATFDRQHRAARPIPAGSIGEREVWLWSFVWMLFGEACLVWMGTETAVYTAILMVCIVVYDAVHKLISLAPVLMAACRLVLYLLAGSAARDGITGLLAWSAVALAAYIFGLSYLARKETVPTPLRYWPLLFLGAPIWLALFVNDGPFQTEGLILALAVLVWILWCVRPTLGKAEPRIGKSVSRLLAGIAMVDLLAVGNLSGWEGGFFVGCLALALLFQRWIPAT